MLPRLMCAILAFALPCAASENRDPHRVKTPDPGLRIRLVIVPAVLPPHHKDHDRERDRDHAVTYNLLPIPEEFSVSRETRAMPVGGMRQEQVQLTTVVLK
ncbi:MAG TPA: hypothetical protein VKQ89_02055 [Candidatus Angelobacter sp.]|nr:hypothetical protein [Candidatus Angelobacter sp.]